MTAPEHDTHLALGLAESAACEPDDWERWVGAVENSLGHDVDGDLRTDGFCIDVLCDQWEAGMSVAEAVEIIHADYNYDATLWKNR